MNGLLVSCVGRMKAFKIYINYYMPFLDREATNKIVLL